MSSNPRVHEIATKYGVDSKTALVVLKDMGEFAKGPSSSLTPPTARKLALALEALGHREGIVRRIHTPSAPSAPVMRTPPRALVDGNPFTRPRVQDTPAEAENRAFIAAVFNIRPDDVKLRRDPARHSRKVSEPSRASKTDVEWASYFFDSAERADWVAAGIGEENARLASDLRQRGIDPWHLQQKIDGRTVAERLRGGDSFDRVVSKALELSA